jgi:DhnA family fructose-bisphosphate aldolase class Ia
MLGIYRELLNGKSGNANIVAMDHGLASFVFDEFKNPGTTLERVLEGKPDCVLISPMIIHRFAGLFAKYPMVKTIATLDAVIIPELCGPMQVFNVDFAIQMGANAVKSLLIFGQPDPARYLDNMKYVARLAEQAKERKVPFMVEAVLWGPEIPQEKRNDPELINRACRVAFELGADLIKTEYTGNQESFRDITANYPIPILVLGGSKTGLEDLFRRVKDAMNAGARGVVIGRNVFQQEYPAKLVKALNSIVNDNVSISEALEIAK